MPLNKKAHPRPPKNALSVSPKSFNIRKDKDFTTYYCNFAQLTFTAMDISITVAEAATEGEQVGVTQTARIFFAPIQAKIMKEMLEATIKQYERKFGEIDVPAAAMPNIEDFDDESGEKAV